MSRPLARSTAVADEPALWVACVEVGASSSQSTLVDGPLVRHLEGVDVPGDRPLLLAVPGLLHAGRVVAASNLGWYDVDPVAAIGLQGEAAVLLGDAQAAALGEYALRGGDADLLYIGLGTGVGGAVVRRGDVVDNLLGHRHGFGDRLCRCGQRGCLETVAAGWALPDPLASTDLRHLGEAVAAGVRAEPLADVDLVVVAGGITRRYPDLVPLLGQALPGRTVTPTAAPPPAKSAAAWGLVHAYRHRP